MSRKTVQLGDGIYVVVEPISQEEYEVAGNKTLIRLKVVEILATKPDIREG